MAEYPKKTQKKAQAESEAIEEAHRQGCVLKQLTMFDCDRKELEQSGIVKCYPIPRVFRICRGHPTVEVTALLRYEDPSGEPYLPKNYLNHLPKGQLWQEIKKDMSSK